jgi:hypothetical protein
MNERSESFPSTATRKKRRRSRFRYSSRKALECSRVLKRTVIAGGSNFTPVTRALSYNSAQTNETCFFDHYVCATGLSGSHLLESIEELHEERERMSIGDASFDGDNI